MKKYILTLLLFALFPVLVFAQHTKKDLIGKWEGTDSQGTKASIQFLDTTKVSVNINGAPLPPYTYTIDLPKSPARLDIVMQTIKGEAILPGFLLFVDSDTIKWQIFPGGKRAEKYDENSPDGPVITLQRVK
ncbi:MAG: hypothetical protein ACHQHN_12155 [Sphingobacteriales bacterium]